MHSLKFRAWCKDTKRFLDCDEWYMTCSGSKYLHYAVMPYKDDNFIIEQYIGLKDKNGQKIYEGDIVDVSSVFVKPKTMVVEFSEFACGYEPFVNGCADCYVPSGKDVKVIGNIHETPELMEAKNAGN